MLAHINSIDHNIQFTSEREVECVIPFLDVEIMRNAESPPTQINTSNSLHTTPWPINGQLFPPCLRELLPIALRTVWFEKRRHMSRRPSAVMVTLSASSFLLNATDLGRTQRTRMTLDPMSLSRTFKVFRKQ